MVINRKHNIVLIGFMGCGKTSIGKRIAANFEIDFIDTDVEISEYCGKSINRIFEDDGEAYFRKLERNICKYLATVSGKVIATGGGIIKDFSNIENLKINGSVVYLKSHPDKIYRNIKTDNSRPLLNTCGNKFELIKTMLEERKPFYEAYADLVTDVTEMRLEESAWQVGRELRRLGLFYEKNKSY